MSRKNCKKGIPCGDTCISNQLDCGQQVSEQSTKGLNGAASKARDLTDPGESLDDFVKGSAANTFAAVVNELALARELAGGFDNVDGFGVSVSDRFLRASGKIDPQEAALRDAQGGPMATAVLAWARDNGFTGAVTKVFWTALPGSLADASGIPNIDQTKNPSDVVIEFDDGKRLGVSAKSTGSSTQKPAFKNRGAGTLGNTLGNSQLSDINNEARDQFIADNNLTGSNKAISQILKQNKQLKDKASQIRNTVLRDTRDSLLGTLNSLPPEERSVFLREQFLDVVNDGLPTIKVTGRSTNQRADVVDIRDNKIIRSLSPGVTFEKLGNDSILVTSETGDKLFAIRAKNASQPLVSPIKFNASESF
jgi:hypothetical protein